MNNRHIYFELIIKAAELNKLFPLKQKYSLKSSLDFLHQTHSNNLLSSSVKDKLRYNLNKNRPIYALFTRYNEIFDYLESALNIKE